MEEQGGAWVCKSCKNTNPSSFPYCVKCKCTRQIATAAQCSIKKVSVYPEEKLQEFKKLPDEKHGRRVLLVGIQGSGKSSLGNSLLGEKVFEAGASPCPVTLSITCGVGEWEGKETVVFDSPGIDRNTADTNQNRFNKLEDMLAKCLLSLSSGFHAVAFVMNVGRFSCDTLFLLKNLKQLFGEFLFVVFTRIDDLDEDQRLSSLIEQSHYCLKKLALECGYIGINNKAIGNEMKQQISTFFEMVDDKTRKNNGKLYTYENFNAMSKRTENECNIL